MSGVRSLLSPLFNGPILTMQILAFFTVVSSIPALFSTLVSASHADGHAGVARLEKHRRTADSLGVGNTTLTKRNFSNARFTYYYDDVAQVACGGWYNGNDYVRMIYAHQGDRVSFMFIDRCLEQRGTSTQSRNGWVV